VLIASHWFRSQRYYDSGAWRGTWKGEGGGIMMNQAPHSLDLLIWLGGQPRSVIAQAITRGHTIEVEDTVSALLDYGGGHSGYFYTTTAQWPGQNRFEFTGERGQLVIEDGKLSLYRLARPITGELRELPSFTGPQGAWEEGLDVASLVEEEEPSGHTEVLRRFARGIREGTPLVADAEDGLRSLELANALLLSGFTHQQVDLPLDRGAYDSFLRDRQADSRS
jgi:predicted dehydrogenase